MKKIIFIACIAITFFTSCNNNPKPVKTKEDISVRGLQKKYLFLAKQTDTYKDAFMAVTKLQIDLNLVNKGNLDSDAVINEYNDAIGKQFGFVDYVYEVKKQMKNKVDTDYLRIIQLDQAAKIGLREVADINSMKK